MCSELELVAREGTQRARELQLPNWRLRLGVGVLLLSGAALLVFVGRSIATTEAIYDVFGRLQGLDAVFNITVVVGAVVLFLVTIDGRAKRGRALADLHQLRSIVHMIDMHQLTKDSTLVREGGPPTPSSPQRQLNAFELSRYLDYCSEMLSLTAKAAALYAQSSSDPIVIDAVNDLERLTANLRQGIWQKITLIRGMPAE